MKKAFRYRIFPTKHQEAILRTQLSLCCELYNAGLEERREAYRMGGKSITFTTQSAQLPDIKELRPEYEGIYSQVLQDVLHRLDKAFQAFFRSFSCDEVEPELVPESEEAVGIDVGLNTFAYLSTGDQIENPRFFRGEEHALARAQRRLSKAEKGTKMRKKRRKVVARIHERIKNRRQNFIHQQVTWLINRFGFIAVEALVVRNMVKNPRLSKSIADAAWSMFFTHLTLKAEEAARCMVKVPPAYTSQTCSMCGHRQKMPLSVRVYDCEQCETVSHRDHNASKTILGLGRQAHVIPEAPAL